MKKNITLFIGIFFLLMFPYSAKATTLQDLYNELSSLEKSYNAAQSKANMTQAELNSVKTSIANTEAEIRQAQNDITQAEKDIAASEESIAKKKEEMNQMLVYLQITSSKGNSMLEYIFEADDYTDFIYRYSVVTQMTDYNQGLVEELTTLVEQLNAKKTELSQKQVELSQKKSDLQAKYAIVQAQYKDEQDDGLSIADQVSAKKKQINMYKNMGCTLNQNINNCGGIGAVDGWVSPLASYYQSSAYAEARTCSRGTCRHYAVDLAVSEGTTVRAVANGKVLARYSSTCGGLVIQIQHNYNGTSYVSLYMHMIDGYVNVGDTVTAGKAIGTSGGGAREIAKWGDTCTEGAHLHFAMAVGASMIGSSSQQGTTFNPVKFFPAMKGIGSRYSGG